MTTIPNRVKQEIEKAIRIRARAKGLETEAKLLIAQAKDTLLPILAAYELEAYSVRGVGAVSSAVSRGSSIQVSKLTEQLLGEGMAPDVISGVIERSSSTWETEYIKFKAEENTGSWGTRDAVKKPIR